MKRATSTKEVIINDKFTGFILEADFTAEHEWGIDGILRKFNVERVTLKEKVDKSIINIKKIETGFKKNKKSNALYLAESKKGAYLYTRASYRDEYPLDFLKRVSDDSGAWDGDDFVIYSENKENLDRLIQAEKENDITITLVSEGDNPFARGGLAILINSLIPEEEKNGRIEAENKQVKLYKRVKKTGIEKLLKKNNKGYYALSPRINEDDILKFWLNPSDQQNNKAGWYTIEELILWTKNEGPIPKKKENK